MNEAVAEHLDGDRDAQVGRVHVAGGHPGDRLLAERPSISPRDGDPGEPDEGGPDGERGDPPPREPAQRMAHQHPEQRGGHRHGEDEPPENVDGRRPERAGQPHENPDGSQRPDRRERR